jgi:hypothetical protein
MDVIGSDLKAEVKGLFEEKRFESNPVDPHRWRSVLVASSDK